MELMVIAVIALIVLGPSRLPEAARSVGKGMREMRNSFQGGPDDDEAGGGGGSDRRGPDRDPDGPEDDGLDDDASLGGDVDEADEHERVGAGQRS